MIYLLRHCKASSQEFDAHLTEDGKREAKKLVRLLKTLDIEMIYSSPMIRAIETVEPFAAEETIEVNLADDLQERVLSENPLDDWKDVLQKSFLDFDFKIGDAESSYAAQNRILDFIDQLNKNKNYLLVSHGNLISLLIHFYDNQFGFNESMNMKNPDLYELNYELRTIRNYSINNSSS